MTHPLYKLDAERDAEMLALHAQGALNTEIARAVGLTSQGVKYALARLGVQGRLGSGDPERDATIWMMHLATETPKAIAASVGMSQTGVKSAIVRISKKRRAAARKTASRFKDAIKSGHPSLTTTDPMEQIIEQALQRAGIRYETDHGGANPSRLDFRLQDYGVEIEVKRFHTDRVAEQMGRAPNVIVAQGEVAVRFLAAAIEGGNLMLSQPNS